MNQKIRLGRFEKVDLRTAWLSEASDFTPWLAREENLSQLAETLGLDLVLEAQEKNVGPFRADLLCKDTLTNNWVLIENQLERTDHTHLGQIITYAAGLKAVTVVWVAAQFTDEHRAALDWLNEVTGEGLNFFGIEVELWKISDSLPAPRFNVVSQPNSWSRSVTDSARAISQGELTETQQTQLAYWQSFSDYLTQQRSPLRPPKPVPSNNVGFPSGRSYFSLIAFIIAKEKRQGVLLVITGPDAKHFFHQLQAEKAGIEQELGAPVEWLEKPDRIESHIRWQMHGVDLANKSQWTAYHKWLAQATEGFSNVFRARIRTLPAATTQNQPFITDDVEDQGAS